jgi:hypothetical protein
MITLFTYAASRMVMLLGLEPSGTSAHSCSGLILLQITDACAPSIWWTDIHCCALRLAAWQLHLLPLASGCFISTLAMGEKQHAAACMMHGISAVCYALYAPTTLCVICCLLDPVEHQTKH